MDDQLYCSMLHYALDRATSKRLEAGFLLAKYVIVRLNGAKCRLPIETIRLVTARVHIHSNIMPSSETAERDFGVRRRHCLTAPAYLPLKSDFAFYMYKFGG